MARVHSVLRAVCQGLALAAAMVIGPHAAAATKPNVLLIVTDDQGYGDLSIHGNPHLKTPHLDRLGESSVRFERFYVHSYCAPTRAALLTGRWPLRTGSHGVTDTTATMRTDEVTLAESLKTAGYRTACIGKWHNGAQFPYTAPGQGFDEFFGFNGGHINDYFDAELLRGAHAEQTKGFVTDVLTDEAIRFVKANRSSPFFCYLAYNAPHMPLQVPDRYFDMFKAQGLSDEVAAFLGMCANIDDNVGRLLAELDALGLANDTIVLFTTDNGATVGSGVFNAGMRGGKGSVHEGGSRVPLFVRWPSAKWTPKVVNTLAAHIDIYPTVLDLCGVTPPPGPKVDGRSLRPLLDGDESPWPERPLFTYRSFSQQEQSPGGVSIAGAVRTPKYRLVRDRPPQASPRPDAAWQLYDMDADPGEKTDLAGREPAVVAELSRLYEEWYTDVSSRKLEHHLIQVGHAQENPVELLATQAEMIQGPRYAITAFSGGWLTGWTKPAAQISFDIDVVAAGDYEVSVKYVCPMADSGSTIRVRAGDAQAEAVVLGTPVTVIPLPHRGKAATTFTNMEWATLRVGTLRLPAGPTRLTLDAPTIAGKQVMDFKSVSLRKEPPTTAAASDRGHGTERKATPNVILIVADDMGYADTSAFGCKDIKTPNLDRIAANGVRFTDAYVTGPICVPSRMGLLTGRYQQRWGIYGNNDGYTNKGARGMAAETTFAELFQQAGYATALVGKWHMCGNIGPNVPPEVLPERNGFDEVCVIGGGMSAYRKADVYRGGGRVEQVPDYLTDFFGTVAVTFIDRVKDKPFLLCLTFNAVHAPLQAEPADVAVHDEISAVDRRTYAAMVTALDRNVGRVLDAVDKAGLGDNTIVAFISDNGAPAPNAPGHSRNMADNGSLRGHKFDVLEGGVRTPMMLQWPGTIPAGKTFSGLTSTMDLPATFLAVARLAAPAARPIDGVNLLPFLTGDTGGDPHETLCWESNWYELPDCAVRRGKWKIVQERTKAGGPQPDRWQLYDLAGDVGEKKDLASVHPDVVRELDAAYRAWRQGMAPSCSE